MIRNQRRKVGQLENDKRFACGWAGRKFQKFSFQSFMCDKSNGMEKKSSSPATRRDSKSSDYSLASCRSPSRGGAAAAAVGGCEAFDFDGAARRQIPSLVDWLNVNLETMRMAWRMFRCRLRSLMDYHTIFEYFRCLGPLRRGWVALWNAVVLTVDYNDSGADDSTADGLDGVSVLPTEATYENWLALTCCDDDMNAIRGIVSPKTREN